VTPQLGGQSNSIRTTKPRSAGFSFNCLRITGNRLYGNRPTRSLYPLLAPDAWFVPNSNRASISINPISIYIISFDCVRTACLELLTITRDIYTQMMQWLDRTCAINNSTCHSFIIGKSYENRDLKVLQVTRKVLQVTGLPPRSPKSSNKCPVIM